MTTLLFVCTGNICRSPTASALAAERLARLEEGISVDSAGTLDLHSPCPPDVIAAAADLGVDVSGHRSRQVSATELRGAELVVGMAREHVREVALVEPAAWPRTFTLREVVRRAQGIGPRRPDQALTDWAHQLHAGRRTADLLGKSPEDDIADPMGGSPQEYREAASTIARLVDQLVALGWPGAMGV